MYQFTKHMVKDTDEHPDEEIYSVKSWSFPISGLSHEDGDPPNHGCVHQPGISQKLVLL